MSAHATATTQPPLNLIPTERIDSRVLWVRGAKVLIAVDLAALYGTETKALNRATLRNRERFPADFMFQLSGEEADVLRRQTDASKAQNSSKYLQSNKILKSQTVTSKPRLGKGSRRHLPYAFSAQGVAMLSGLLDSLRTVAVNIGILHAFSCLRQMIATPSNLAHKVASFARACDAAFTIACDAIRELMTPTASTKKGEIGFLASVAALGPRRAF